MGCEKVTKSQVPSQDPTRQTSSNRKNQKFS